MGGELVVLWHIFAGISHYLVVLILLLLAVVGVF